MEEYTVQVEEMEDYTLYGREMDDYTGRRDGGLYRQKRFRIIQVERWMIIQVEETDDYAGRRDG